jgi:hypothetical protein
MVVKDKVAADHQRASSFADIALELRLLFRFGMADQEFSGVLTADMRRTSLTLAADTFSKCRDIRQRLTSRSRQLRCVHPAHGDTTSRHCTQPVGRPRQPSWCRMPALPSPP